MKSCSFAQRLKKPYKSCLQFEIPRGESEGNGTIGVTDFNKKQTRRGLSKSKINRNQSNPVLEMVIFGVNANKILN